MKYNFNIDEHIWLPSHASDFSYSDGDEVENRIAHIIKQSRDLSVLSTDLTKYISDWPSLYHLSPSRANLLRPYAHLLRGTTLEIGAGCGAITRYLGELGGTVIAVEGSRRRASIAAARTHNLPNVKVFCDRLQQFEYPEQFDVVTLIGVLEYARVYNKGEQDPILVMLQKARSFLKPDGVLFIAIENQLGLKYFAGAPEDHTGKSMFGIQELYTDHGPVTFGHKELTRYLQKAEFQTIQFALPFPDYKLPSSVVMPAAQDCDDFNSAVFATESVKQDKQLKFPLLFALEKTWQVIGNNGLLPDLANSFLIAASLAPSHEKCAPTNILAYHFSTNDRLPAFCKEACFIKEDDKIVVRRKILSSQSTYENSPSKPFSFKLFDEDYALGKSLSIKFSNLLSTEGWHINSVGNLLLSYIDIIYNAANMAPFSKNPNSAHTLIPRHLLDLIPQNIIVNKNTYTIIDQEWTYQDDIELGYLVFRGLLNVLHKMTVVAKPRDITWLKLGNFFKEALTQAGLTVTHTDLEKYFQLEAHFQTFVTGRESTINYVTWSNCHLPTSEHHGQITFLLNTINNIYASRSWRITKPLRKITAFVKIILNYFSKTSKVVFLKSQSNSG